MKHSIFVLMVFCFCTEFYAQKLYMPRNIQKAFTNGTRDFSGEPGKNYWQNRGNYDVAVKVDAITKIVSGSEKINYSNNSPNDLKNIVIRFVNNIHKPNAPRSGYVSNDFLSSGLKIKSLKINQISYQVDSENWGTVASIDLKNPILSKTNSVIEIDWEYPLSVQSGREGQIDSETFYVAYSYPRVSVYDDYNGWDMIPHSDHQEFYNDFNNYKFAISAPKNYVVWATGTLQNASEVLQTEFLNRFNESLKSDKIIEIANEKEIKSGLVTTQNDWNVWRFEAKDISDFCFALSNHYVWDASSVQLKTKRVSIQAAYNQNSEDFKHYGEWMRYNLKWFSENWPGIEYPYPTMTAFQGFADMEYPMMINDSSMPENLEVARLIADHEIAHTYFPFYMGINETRYAYMDEGWATTLEYLIGIDEISQEAASEFYKKFRVNKWINSPDTEQDQPIITMSTQVTGRGYGNNSYVKASLSYLALKDYLGDELFKKALHLYMTNWHGKHPIPWDYFYSMNAGSGKNLNWFWNNWFYSNHYIDLKIKSATNKKITIENIGGFAVPFDVILKFEDNSTEKTHYTPVIWQKDEQEITLKISNKKKIKAIQIDGGIFMDYTPEDNSITL